MKVVHKGLLIILVPLLMQVAMLLGVQKSLDDAKEDIDETARCRDVLAVVDSIRRENTRECLASFFSTGDQANRELQNRKKTADARIEAAFHELEQLTKNSAEESKLAAECKSVIKYSRALQRLLKQLPPGYTTFSPAQEGRAGSGAQHIDRIKMPVVEFIALYGKSANALPQKVKAMRSQVTRLLICAGLLTCGTALFLVFWLGTDMSRRLDHVFANARRMMLSQELDRPIVETDEIAALDETLYSSATALRANEEFRQGLVATVSHELRTPLSSVGAAMSVLSSGTVGKLSDRANELLRSATKTALGLMSMINNLLDLDRLESGKLSSSSQNINLADAIQSATNFVFDAAAAKGIIISIAPASPILVCADREQILRLCEELLSAVVQHADAGSEVNVSFLADNSLSIAYRGASTAIDTSVQTESESEESIADVLRWSVCQSLSGLNNLKLSLDSTSGQCSIVLRVVRKDASALAMKQPLPTVQLLAPPAGILLIKRIWLVLVIPVFICQVMFFIVASDVLTKMEQQLLAEYHSWKIMAAANLVTLSVSTAGMNATFYKATGDPLLRTRFADNQHDIREQYNKFADLLGHESAEKKRLVEEFKRAIDDFVRFTEEAIERPDSIVEEMMDDRDKSHLYNIIERYLVPIEKLIDEEKSLQDKNRESTATIRKQIESYVFATLIFSFVSMIGLSAFLTTRVTRRLSALMETAQLLSKRKLLQPVLRGHDEFAKLDQILHFVDRELSSFEKFKSRIAGVMKRRLSNSLALIRNSMTELAEMEGLAQRARTRAGNVAADCSRLLRLVNDLMSVQTMEAGKFYLELESTTTDEIIDIAVLSVEPLTQRAGVTIEKPPASLPLLCDRDRMIQVLINLLSNAIKFSDPDSSIELDVREVDGRIEITVTDFGRGIAPEQQERLFQRFEQAESSDWRDKKGSGLGLYICRTIVSEHGGDLGFSSETGKGSRFWVRLPKAAGRH